ncbi:MAG TPA: hypothetical protein ENI64_13380 [Gammaproteobacteria bacterium]|nr:hypothetical protein [Gammaproteobacteria bacterium]
MQQKLMFVLTILLSGRAMTLAYIHRVGGSAPGDPPPAWLMPLVGDAVIGVLALWIAYLVIKKTGLWVWVVIIVWNALAIWDAMSAFIIHITNPWPEFFMIQLLGPAMFFAASAMHLVIIILASQSDVRKHYLE